MVISIHFYIHTSRELNVINSGVITLVITKYGQVVYTCIVSRDVHTNTRYGPKHNCGITLLDQVSQKHSVT